MLVWLHPITFVLPFQSGLTQSMSHHLSSHSSLASPYQYHIIYPTIPVWLHPITSFVLPFQPGLILSHHLSYHSSLASSCHTIWPTIPVWPHHVTPFDLPFQSGLIMSHHLSYHSSLASSCHIICPQVLGDVEGFEEAVRNIIKDARFDCDVIVSVFETNIRILG